MYSLRVTLANIQATSANNLDLSVNIVDCPNSVDYQRMKDLLANMLGSSVNISVRMESSWVKLASIQVTRVNRPVRLVRTKVLLVYNSAMSASSWVTWASMSVMLASIADLSVNMMDSWENNLVTLVCIVAVKVASMSSADGTMDSWMGAKSLLSNSLKPANNVDSLVNNAAARLDSDLLVSSQDLLTCIRDSLANSLDYSANSLISNRAMLMDSLDLMVNMLVKRLAMHMSTVTLMDCLANRVSQYDLVTIQATIQTHPMHLKAKNLDRRESYRLL